MLLVQQLEASVHLILSEAQYKAVVYIPTVKYRQVGLVIQRNCLSDTQIVEIRTSFVFYENLRQQTLHDVLWLEDCCL